MTRLILLLVFVVQPSLELQLMEYQMHMTRKSRSNVAPVESGYVYSKVNNNPGTIATFGNGASAYTPQVTEPNTSLHIVNNSRDTYEKHSTNSDVSSGNYQDKHIISKKSILDNTHNIDNTLEKHYGGDYPGYYNSLPKGKYDDKMINYSPPIHHLQVPTVSNTFPSKHSGYSVTEISPMITEPGILPYSIDYEIAKSEAKYNSEYLPSKMKAEAELEKLKSAMHYRPSPDVAYDLGYNTFNSFYVDEDDVRTSSRSPYDDWPYFYHSPFEYDHKNIGDDNSLQKAVDKRYAVDSNPKVNLKTIPVYEHQEYDKPYNTPYIESTTKDNPLTGHQPFFSFVLNDYYEKNGDDDALNFKGLEWGQDFDYGHGRPYVEDITAKHQSRPSRQDNSNTFEHRGHLLNNGLHSQNYNTHESKLGDSSTEKGYTKSHEFVKQEKGDKESSEHQKAHEQNGQKQKQFKHFLDSFVNKFGGEENNKNTKYALQRNQDKGEKKKGFRRVYHKDEYQEDNEFYDNTNNKAHVHEDAQSSGHFGGTEAFLKSQATAAMGDKSGSHSNKGNTQKSKFENNHNGNDKTEGIDYDFNRYREEAKKAARMNSAEYPDYTGYN